MSVFTILRRNIKWRFHNAFTIVIIILQPLLWLVLYSTVAGQTMKDAGIENYTAYILPGLIVLVSFSACSSSGIMNYMMKADGSFYRILIAPVRRSSVILGQVLEAVLCAFFEVAVMIAVSLLFGIRLQHSVSALPAIIVLVFLAAFCMASLCYGISLVLPNEVMYETVMNAIVLPVFFLSSALFPTDAVKGVLAFIINLNPFTHVINGIRSLLLYGTIEAANIIFVMLLFAVMGSISFGWAFRRLKKEMSL